MPPVPEMTEAQPSRWHSLRPWSRHSLVLLVSGLAYVATGISYILAAPTPARLDALQIALLWTDPFNAWFEPFAIWGCIFILTGLAAVLSSRWPPASETWGYTMMTGLSSAWGLFYLVGVFFGSSPSNLSGFVAWCLLGFVWWAVSGLRNPAPVVVFVPVKDKEDAERLDHIVKNSEMRS